VAVVPEVLEALEVADLAHALSEKAVRAAAVRTCLRDVMATPWGRFSSRS
jgi:hypothetical protein